MAWWQGKEKVREYLKKVNENGDVRLSSIEQHASVAN
jgi:hypothetical protein